MNKKFIKFFCNKFIGNIFFIFGIILALSFVFITLSRGIFYQRLIENTFLILVTLGFTIAGMKIKKIDGFKEDKKLLVYNYIGALLLIVVTEMIYVYHILILGKSLNLSKILILIVPIAVFILYFNILIYKEILKEEREEEIFRFAKKEDKDKILEILIDGANALKEAGIDQWQGKFFPNEQDVNSHLEKDSYVLTSKGEIVATCVLADLDKDYEISEISWNTKSPYYAIHRVSVSNRLKGKGYAKVLMEKIEEKAKKDNVDLRVDTHEDNKIMQSLLEKMGYKKCGEVILHGELKRVAFDKKISK